MIPLFVANLLTLLPLLFAQDGDLTLGIRPGFDGLYEESAAVPVIVTARNDGTAVEGEIRVSAGAAGADGPIYSAPISLPTGSDKRVPLVVYMPPFGDGLTVQLVSEGQVIAESEADRLKSVGRDELLYGVVSSDPGGLAFLETIRGGRSDSAVAFLEPADLPEVSSAWNALDVVILDDTDTSRLTAGQSAALRAWVENGGQLVVTGGPGGPQTAVAMAELLPVAVAGVESLDDLPALSAYAGAPLDAPGPYVITSSTPGEGEVLIDQDGTPILAHRQIGRGGVYFLALDPKLAPLAAWSGSELLWEAIAATAPSPPPWARGVRDGYAATQAVAYIPGLRLPSVWQLFFFLLLYTVIIGPINFFILRRRNRPELAWITIPALVLLFSAVTFLTGFRTRGNNATLNVLSVLYGSIEADRLRAQSVLGLYSPRRATYDVGLPYDSSTFPFQAGFGALTGASNLESVARAGEVLLRNVRTDTSEVTTFITEAHLPRPAISADAALSADGGAVEVVVRNDNPTALEDAVILYGQDQLSLGDLAPGEERSVELPLSAVSPSAGPTPDPLFPTAVYYPNPLINDPSKILGTADYYNDPVAYPRWQLIQSHFDGETFDPATLPAPTEIVTLGGWLAGSTQEARVVEAQETSEAGDSTAQTGVTLLLLEIPVR